MADANERVSTKACNNPIYDSLCDKAKRLETDKYNSRKLSMSDPEHQFDNPIYGTNDTENA